MAAGGRKNADEALIGGLAGGLTVEEAARRAGISARTAHRRLHDPAFRQRLQEARTALLDRTVGWLAKTSIAAVQELAKVALHGESESAKVSACRTILEYTLRARADLETEQRLAAVEEKLTHGQRADSSGAG